MNEYKNEYKKSIDNLCDKNLKLEASDILNAYDRKGHRKVTSISRYLGIAAACFITVGVIGVAGIAAGAAGFGPLASLFAKKTGAEADDPEQARTDSISADLAERGYMIKTDETQSVDIFDVTFEGITGDWTGAQMIFTIHVNDADYAREHDKLYMTVYRGFDESMYSRRVDTVKVYDDDFYENISDYILFDTATAYRVDETSQDYLLTYSAYEYYMIPGNTIYTEVRSIRTSESSLIEPQDGEIMLNCTYSFILPTDINALAQTYQLSFVYRTAPKFKDENGVEYHVSEVNFSAYDTEVLCEFYYTGTSLAYVDSDFDGNYKIIGEAHQAVSAAMRLIVDGVEYEPIDLGGVYNDPSGLRRGMTTFPNVDYANASSVILTYNGTEIVLK